MDIVEYNGWPNNVRLTNGRVELIVTRDVGPRVIRLGFLGERNLFAEIAGQQGTQGEEEWMIRGGHRFWIAPESKPETYELDNVAVETETIPHGVRTRQAAGPLTGVQKTMDIALDPHADQAVLVHTLTNATDRAVDCAPWALSVMAVNGMAIIPLPARIAHADRLTHNQEWSLWGYTDFSDPRWTLGQRYILFRQDPTRGPNKLGLAHREGWVAYVLGEFLFVKRFTWQEGATYLDGGVNFETFANEEFLEIESLGPRVTLQPGASATHEERWSLYRGLGPVNSEADIEEYVIPRIAEQ